MDATFAVSSTPLQEVGQHASQYMRCGAVCFHLYCVVLCFHLHLYCVVLYCVSVQHVREEVETAHGSSEAAVDGVSCGGVAGSSAEEVNPVVEDVEAYVAAQLSDGEACQQHRKQWESELLAVKLLKASGTCGRG